MQRWRHKNSKYTIKSHTGWPLHWNVLERNVNLKIPGEGKKERYLGIQATISLVSSKRDATSGLEATKSIRWEEEKLCRSFMDLRMGWAPNSQFFWKRPLFKKVGLLTISARFVRPTAISYRFKRSFKIM